MVCILIHIYVETKYLQTKVGTKLITSGWWGMSRHINYFGDWLMALSYSLPCGFATPIPYFYPIYFAILLLHRERRDDHKCRTKYGEDWEKYCKLVKYRIIPGKFENMYRMALFFLTCLFFLHKRCLLMNNQNFNYLRFFFLKRRKVTHLIIKYHSSSFFVFRSFFLFFAAVNSLFFFFFFFFG
jgi:hypothetical protein